MESGRLKCVWFPSRVFCPDRFILECDICNPILLAYSDVPIICKCLPNRIVTHTSVKWIISGPRLICAFNYVLLPYSNTSFGVRLGALFNPGATMMNCRSH